MAEASLGRAALRYTALRFGVLGGCFALAALVLLPTVHPASHALALSLLAALVLSVPVSLVVGRRLREEMAAALAASREAGRARVSDTQARVAAAREQAERPSGHSGPTGDGV